MLKGAINNRYAKPLHPVERNVGPDDLFRAIFEQAAVGVAQIETLTGRFVRVNRRYCDIVGLSNEELTATTFMAITHPDDLQADLDNMEELKAGRIRAFSMEKRYCRNDGTVVWVNLTVSPMWNSGERPTFHIAVVQDITDRKRTEAALRESETQLRMSLDASSAGIWSWDPLRNMAMWDARYHEQYGFHPMLAPSYDRWIARVHAEDRRRLERRIQELLQPHGGDVWHEEFRASHPLKGERWMESRGRVERDHQGQAVRFAGINLDITDRKGAEEALRTSEERFRLMAEVTNDVLWDWDLVADRHWWSPNAIEKFGYDPGREPGVQAWSSRLHPGDQKRILNQLRDIFRSGDRTFHSEYRFLLADGSYGHFLDKGLVVRDAGGQLLRMIGVMIDVTAAKRAYATLQEAYARHQTLSRAIHVAEEKERRRLSRELHDEFGQLLSALKFDLIRLAEDLGRKPARRPAAMRKKVTAAAGTVDRLFASLREMIRGLRPAVLEELGLVPAIEALAADVQERTGLHCRVTADREGLGKRFGPELEGTLFRIAQELLTNVVRHAKASTVTVTLGCLDGWAHLTVRDDGRGVRGETASRANRFGLRGIRERAELLGGTVVVRSQRGAGTTATVAIPLRFPPSLPLEDLRRSPSSASTRSRDRHATVS